ncbi:MAG: hypothetical protein IKI50_07740 [Clostridia bacterium]|nr:hypothetical protein [Clostridia bacterium]
MSVTEKVAYLKGLIEGQGIDPASKEGQLLKAICDVLADLALDQEDLQDTVAELSAQVDEIDEDLNTVEKDLYEDEDDEDEEEEFYDVTCPKCNTEFSVDEQTLLDGGVDCPDCGEHIEFDLDECDCDCDDCKKEEK